MVFTIPNVADAAAAAQSEPDSVDMAMIAQAMKGDGVTSDDMAIVQDTGSNMVVKTSTAGVAVIGGVRVGLAAGVTGAITAAHATLNRFDLVSVNTSSALVVTAGTAAASPVFPAIPASNVVLAAVWVPATDTAITNAQIVDKRFVIPKRPFARARALGDGAVKW